MKQIAWDEVMKRLEVASKICNDASPVQVEGPIHVGVDLGTADVVVMAVDDNGMPVSAFLEWATVVRDGVVVDYHGAITIVKRLVSMTEERLGRKITEASTSYPPGTDARLSTNILDAANLRLVSTADEPSCLARLARLDRAAVVDIGGGTTEVGVISLGGMVYSGSVRVGGDKFDQAIVSYVRRNFGMPSPEGYRKTLRLMKQAEKFHRPVICLVDTPGAFCGMEAEERGQGEAIARNLFEMSDLTVPVLSIVIGEGGSGGALAMAVANEVWMMENAVYSVLSPEGFASILWKDSKRADEAARVMKMTAAELKELGIIERVIPEPEPADPETLPEIAKTMENAMEEFIEAWTQLDGKTLAERRYERFRKF